MNYVMRIYEFLFLFHSPLPALCFSLFHLSVTHTHYSHYLISLPASVGKALYGILVIQAFRADRLLAMASIFVATVLGETFLHAADQELDLGHIVTTEVIEGVGSFLENLPRGGKIEIFGYEGGRGSIHGNMGLHAF